MDMDRRADTVAPTHKRKPLIEVSEKNYGKATELRRIAGICKADRGLPTLLDALLVIATEWQTSKK